MTLATGLLRYHPKRAAPTVTTSGSTHFVLRFLANNITTTAMTFGLVGHSTAQWSGTIASGGTASGCYFYDGNGGASYIDINARL